MKSRIDLLVCYDVETVSEGGRRRLRRMARACSAYGQRVQYSVFELNVTQALLAKFIQRAVEIMDGERDSLRVYRLGSDRDEYLQVFGRDGWVDFEEPLVV
jgi:CRISPR-associated protein Cas2